MSGLSAGSTGEAQKAANGAGSPIDDAMAAYEAVSPYFAAAKSAYEVGKAIYDLLSSDKLEQLKTQVDLLASAVSKGFAALGEQVAAGQLCEYAQRITDQVVFLRNRAGFMLYLLGLPTPPTDGDIRDVDLPSDDAIDILNADSYWQSAYHEGSLWQDSWSGPMPVPGNPRPGDLVFDHTLALPAFLEGLACRLSILLGLYPDHASVGYATRVLASLPEFEDPLITRHAQIRDNMVKLRPPTRKEAFPFFDFPIGVWSDQRRAVAFSEEQWPTWNLNGRLFGAVDLYSNYASVGPYPPFDDPPPRPRPYDQMALDYDAGNFEEQVQAWLESWPPYQQYKAKMDVYYPAFAARHAICTLRAWKEVYRATLLDSARRAIQTLRALQNKPPLDLGPDERWSLREADATARDAAGAASSTSVRMRLFAAILKGRPVDEPVTFRELVENTSG